MTIADIAQLIGMLISAWALGFAGGHAITVFKQAMNQV